MADGSAPARSVGVEFTGDLSKLNTAISTAEAKVKSGRTQMVRDLGEVETKATQTARAVEGLASSSEKVAKTARDAGRAHDGMAQSVGRVSPLMERMAVSMRRLISASNDHDRLMRQAGAANDNVARSFGNADRAVGSAAGRLIPLMRGLAAAFTLAAGAAAVGSFAKAGLQMESLERGFGAAAGSAQQGAREFNFIRDTSDKLGLALGETAKQYLGFLAASQGTALQGKATRDIFVAVTSAMGALGKGGEETSRALIAVQQMMSKGKVSAEEMTGQLGEALPGALSLSAKAMGMTQAELLKMMASGKLLASDLLPKLAAELQRVYGGAALEAANGLQANMNRLSTAWLDFSSTVAKNGLNDALSRAAGDMAAFVRDGTGGAESLGRGLGAAIDALRAFGAQAVSTYQDTQVILTMLGEFDQATTRPTVDTSGIEGAFAGATSGIVDAARSDINTAIGIFVAGYQMAMAAWEGLPAAFASFGAAAANGLISAVEGAVNVVIGGFNKVVDAINAVGGNVPGFTALAKAAEVSFSRVETASAGAAGKLASDLATIGKDAMSRDYLSEAGTAISKRFGELKEAQQAAREERKRLADQLRTDKAEDYLRNTGEGAKQAAEDLDKASKAAKAAAQEFAALKSTAEAAAKILFPEEMLKKQGEELQAQLDKYRDKLAEIDPRYVTAVEAKIKLNLEGKELEAVENKTDKLSKDMAHAFSGVFDEMFSAGNKGLDGMLGSITKGLARIGTRSIEQNLLTPLMSGKEFKFDTDAIADAVKTGSFDGISLKFDDLLKPRAGGGFASSKLGSGLIAVGTGASLGYQSQSPIMGALGGALAGLATGNPLMAAAGPALGHGGMIGKRRTANDNPKPEQEKPADDRDQRPLAA